MLKYPPYFVQNGLNSVLSRVYEIYWYLFTDVEYISGVCLFCFHVRLFIVALWSPAGKGLTSWLSFVMPYCEFVTFPLVSRVR